MKNDVYTQDLRKLSDECLKRSLIDQIELQDETVTIVRHNIVRFKLEVEQAAIFLARLLKTNRTVQGSR